ncbi:MAG: glycosyltransferase family 4 protein [Planctomycetota bacterium]|jgi:glycosyltransferase involved in cell wall biosynthesis
MAARIRSLSVLNKLYRGGHENRLLTFAQTIDRDRFDHRIVTLNRDPARTESEQRASGSLRPDYAAAGIHVDDLGLDPISSGWSGRLNAPAKFATAVRRLVRYIREHDIQLLDAHHTVAMLAAGMAGRITGVPVIQTAYHTGVWQRPGLHWPGRQTLSNAAAIVTDSQFRANEIREWTRCESVPIHVIPTGIPEPVPTVSAEHVRSELGLPPAGERRIVGQVSGLLEFKGHLDLLEAAPRVLAEHPDVTFLCVGFSRGFTEYETRLKNRITELGLTDRFLLRGWPGPIGDVWQVFDVFTHPSRFDSLPLVVIEAMALAKPSVVTSVGGITEFVAHEQSGLVVPSESPELLADTLNRLLTDSQLGSRLGENARQTYESQLTPAAMTLAVESLYAEVVSGSATGGVNAAASRAA